jgi:hypothetical protein
LPIGDGDDAGAGGSGASSAAASAEAYGGQGGCRLGWLPGWIVWRTAHRKILQRRGFPAGAGLDTVFCGLKCSGPAFWRALERLWGGD